MEKKSTFISLIFVGIIVLSAGILVIVSGITARELNYVQLEVNPRVEILCDKKFNVVSMKPLNLEAEIIMSDFDYKGKDIEDVASQFMDMCARCGYLDINGSNNAVNITVVDGITQALDVHVVQSINDYLLDNEILCAIVESTEDRSVSDNKKESDVCCNNKYRLMETILNYTDNQTIESLNKLSEIELIDMVANIHSTEKFNPKENTKQIQKELINKNKEKYDRHQKAISKNTQKEFGEVFDKYKKENTERFAINFREKYSNWQKNIID